METLEYLFRTETGIFFCGAFISVGVSLSLLAICFYTVFKNKVLLLFAIQSPLIHPLFLSANTNPRELLDLGGHTVWLPLLHLLVALAIYCFYRLVKEIIGEAFGQATRDKVFTVVVSIVVAVRIITAFSISELTIRAAAFVTIFFFLMIAVEGLFFHPRTFAEKLAKYSLITFTLLSIYPFIRTGILPPAPSDNFVVVLVMAVLSIFSVVWFFALIEITRENFSNLKILELQKRARAFIDLRDLMNTPIQVLVLGLEILESVAPTETTNRMRKAVQRLTNVSKRLNRFENDVNWNDSKNFFEPPANLQ
jgi:hypothetical protein